VGGKPPVFLAVGAGAGLPVGPFVNTVTGEGLAHALAGAQVVVDVANAPSWEDNAVLAFFETSGCNLLAAEAAAGIGQRGVAVRVSAEQSGQVTLPANAHFQGDHHVVRYECGANGVVIGDPASGTVRLSRELFALMLEKRKTLAMAAGLPAGDPRCQECRANQGDSS
jgi:hypothetical protein